MPHDPRIPVEKKRGEVIPLSAYGIRGWFLSIGNGADRRVKTMRYLPVCPGIPQIDSINN